MISLLETRRSLIVILGLGLFAMAARGVADPDVWWHLRTGQLIVQNHAVFHTDPYSFTRFGQPWVNQEWLSEVLISSLYRVAGWSGLIVGFAAISAATFLLVFWRCPGRPYVAAVLTVWGAVASAPLWGVRPQVLSLLLACSFLLILERSDEHPTRLWWMAPLMLLWVNLHAGYALGIALLVLFLAGGLLDAVFGCEAWSQAAPRLRRLGLAAALCLAMVPLNPNGARMYWYPMETLHSPAIQNYIEEWVSPDFHAAKHLAFLFLLLATMAAIPLSPRRLRPRELLLLAVTTYAGLRSVRHIPIAVLVIVPILTGLVQSWMEQHGSALRSGPGRPPAIPRMLVNAIVLAAFAVFTVVRVRTVVRGQAETEAQKFPAAAVSFLSAERPPGPILNHYNWGGYFIWKLYPGYRVYVDGRTDLYGDSFMEDRASVYYLNTQAWADHLQRWQIRTVFLPPDAPLVTALRTRPQWKQVYADSQATILTQTR